MNYFLCEMVFLFFYSRQCIITAGSSGDDKITESEIKNEDDREYRFAAGESYFASIGYNDRDSWVDPYNMFDYDTAAANQVRMRNSESVKPLIDGPSESTGEKKQPAFYTIREDQEFLCTGNAKRVIDEQELRARKCGLNEHVYIIRWLQKFLRKMNYSPEMDFNKEQVVQFSVANRELLEISKLLDSENLKDIQDVESIFNGILMQLYVFQPESTSFNDVFNFVKNNFIVIFALLMCLVLVWLFRMLCYNYSRLSLKLAVIFICLVSFIWTWVHMYQKEIAKKQAILHSLGYPKECEQNNLDYLSFFGLYLRTLFFELEDKCGKYYEAQVVDPFWKVSPLMVLSETASNFLLQPLGSIASHCNIFLKNMFCGMPLIMLTPTAFFAFILLLMLCRYKLKFPFSFMTLEPLDANRIEFLQFRSADEREIAHAASVDTQQTLSIKPQHVPQDLNKTDFNGSGDYLQAASCHNMQQDQIVMRKLEVHKLSTETVLNDNATDAENTLNGFSNISGTSVFSKASMCSLSKITLKDQSSQTDTL